MHNPLEVDGILRVYERLKANLTTKVLGKEDAINKSIVALLCNGHLLLDDVPGTAKTTLAKSMAQSIGGDFKRVQFTPDLLPMDVTGMYYYDQRSSEFVLRKGAVFANVLLADEVNRATPRTQSSLLECMEERQVSIDGDTYPLESPFFVIATQNPVESFGTYPLPEAQLDRFFMSLTLGYPEHSVEDDILRLHSQTVDTTPLSAVVSKEELLAAQRDVKHVSVGNFVREYILSLVDASREHKDVQLGVSTRGAIALMRATQGVASIRNRNYACPEDVQYVARDVLAHRIVLKRNTTAHRDDVVHSIIESVPVPR